MFNKEQLLIFFQNHLDTKLKETFPLEEPPENKHVTRQPWRQYITKWEQHTQNNNSDTELETRDHVFLTNL